MGRAADKVNAEAERFLKANSVDFSVVDDGCRETVLMSWAKVFAWQVKEKTGSWVHAKFRWHGFSYGYQDAVEGEQALQLYSKQWLSDYFVFDEDGKWCVSCESTAYPDLTSLGRDLYVVHHNMKWTMVFTHECPDVGPFFATKV